MRRTPRAILLALVSALVAAGLTTTSVSNASAAEARAIAAAPTATKSARAAGTAAADLRAPVRELLRLPQPEQGGEAGHPQPGAEQHQGHLGRPPDEHRHADAWQRQDPHRHLDLRRLGDRARTGRGACSWCERAGGRRQGGQQGARRPGSTSRSASAADCIRPGYPASADTVSFARECRGRCRGPGGTAHAKYFLFDKIGRGQQRYVTFQTSMNLTRFGYTGQWNQATVMKFKSVYDDYLSVFKQARLAHRDRESVPRARRRAEGSRLLLPPARALGRPRTRSCRPSACVSCTGAGYGGTANHRTRIRIIQYAMYGDRGVWIAKRLRQPVERRLRRPDHLQRDHPSGAADPAQRLRPWTDPDAAVGHQEQCRRDREVQPQQVDDDHRPLGRPDLGVGDLQRLGQLVPRRVRATTSRCSASATSPRPSPTWRRSTRTWNQKTSKKPPHARLSASGRALPIPGVPETAPTWGKGIYKFMQP